MLMILNGFVTLAGALDVPSKLLIGQGTDYDRIIANSSHFKTITSSIEDLSILKQ